MKIKDLPISSKVYRDIKERFSNALAAMPPSLKATLEILENYLGGQQPESSDPVAMAIFATVRPELDRAMERSRRARERGVRLRTMQKDRKSFEEYREAARTDPFKKIVVEGIEAYEEYYLRSMVDRARMRDAHGMDRVIYKVCSKKRWVCSYVHERIEEYRRRRILPKELEKLPPSRFTREYIEKVVTGRV